MLQIMLHSNYMKACLEGLSEKEKQKIQGYFRRGRASSERFEDVERALLNLVDNS